MTFQSNESHREDLKLVVYEGNFALVTEKRKLPTDSSQWIRIQDLPQTIDLNSLILNEIAVEEWSIQRASGVSQLTILQALTGEIILFGAEGTPKERHRLIASVPDLVLKNIRTKEILLNPDGEVAILSIPPTVSNLHTFLFRVDENVWPNAFTMTYLTNELSWQAHYLVLLGKDKMKVNGFIEVKNNTGSSFINVSLQTMAGETKRIRQEEPTYIQQNKSMMLMDSSESIVTEEGEGELHLFTIPFRVDLHDQQSTVIPFIDSILPYRLYYVAIPGHEHPISTIAWKHDSDMPLAKGIMTFYYERNDQVLFAGEDRISYSPKNKEIESQFGRAVDIDSEYALIRRYKSGEDTIEEHEYRLRNGKDQEAEMVIIHPFYYKTWELIEASEDILYQSASELQLHTTLAPEQSKVVTFTVKVKKK
ncbi:DUF4139 domain-containing protein [Jeotgalibacillus marinus]|uniref:DUF4139 domain-containing protein n=1 Tax=Jeotgalibacillus marinus TaxID=86667 RepID=A0ABV3Q4J3_9BACL